MNRDISLLREVVVKLTQMLSGMGLKVTQQGAKAFVERDANGKPVRVNIPQIPDNATPDLVTAIQGFVDHEVSRVLFDDYSIASAIKADKQLSALHSMVSDTYVEREMGKRFPGSIYNMKQLHGFFLDHITKKAIKSPDVLADPMKQFETLIMPVIRSWSGQERFTEFLDENNLWNLPVIKDFVDRVPDSLKERIKKISSPAEALEVAKMIQKIMENEALSGDGDGDDESDGNKDDKSKKNKSKKSKSKSDKSESDKSKKNKSKSDKGDKSEGEDEDQKDEGEGEDGDGGEGENEDGDGEDEGEGEGEGESGEGDSDEEGEDGDGEADGDGDGEPKPGEKLSKDRPDHYESSLFGSRMPNLDASSFEEEMSKFITADATKAIKDSPYHVYTKDFDVIKPYEVDTSRYNHSWLTSFDDEVRHMIGVMQKDIERMMAAQSRSVYVPGQRSGKLCAPNLHRLTVNDGRVFKKLEENKAKDISVSLVVDNSGSMSGSKMTTAMHAAYALAMTLERVKIPCEAIGFTTFPYHEGRLDGGRIKAGDGYSPSAIQREEERIRNSPGMSRYFKFSRAEPLYMPIYKGWNERMTPVVKARFADAAHVQRHLCQNIDGECVENAVFRLMSRPTKRHVCIVLSDGQPAGAPAKSDHLYSHLKNVVKDASKMGVEMVGIGIQSSAVSSFYPRHFVINNVSQLPEAVMKELKRILMK